jgi:endonuclease-8
MPEGPSIVIAREELASFIGKKVESVSGTAKVEIDRIEGAKIKEIRSWGKHLLICFNGFFLRIHFMMFGSYLINERKERKVRLALRFKNSEINFYTCSVRLIEGRPEDMYDWQADVMSEKWNAKKAINKLKKLNGTIACDALLNQEIFAGVGNIIKNEVLFRVRMHPLSVISELPRRKLLDLVKEARLYSFDFYEWRKASQLRKHWHIYKKKECPRCLIPVKRSYLGAGKRLTCYCDNCQIQY